MRRVVIDGVVAQHHLVLHRQLPVYLDTPAPLGRRVEIDGAEVNGPWRKALRELFAQHPGRLVPVALDADQLVAVPSSPARCSPLRRLVHPGLWSGPRPSDTLELSLLAVLLVDVDHVHGLELG